MSIDVDLQDLQLAQCSTEDLSVLGQDLEDHHSDNIREYSGSTAKGEIEGNEEKIDDKVRDDKVRDDKVRDDKVRNGSVRDDITTRDIQLCIKEATFYDSSNTFSYVIVNPNFVTN